jgi:hypothetical protein
MSDLGSIVEYMGESDLLEVRVVDSAAEPLERLEARLCELAGHLTAASCQFLLLIADFDQRQGWADWQMPSCAAWLSWKCQIAPGTLANLISFCKRHP